jgi:hypothetical protein
MLLLSRLENKDEDPVAEIRRLLLLEKGCGPPPPGYTIAT